MKKQTKQLPIMSKTGDYILSLDIGTDSVGYAVNDLQGQPIELNGRVLLGAVTFPSGENKDKTRVFRGQRRSNHRTKNRRDEADRKVFIPLAKRLNIKLAPLEVSGLTKADRQKQGIKYQDPIRAHHYQTIYHAMDDAINNHKKLDIDVIRTVVLNLLTNRGSFVNPASVESFNLNDFDFHKSLVEINTNLSVIFGKNVINVNNESAINDLINAEGGDYKKVPALSKLISDDKACGTAIAKAILGYKFQLNDIYNNPIKAKDAKAEWSLDFSKATADDDIDALSTGLTYEESSTLTLLNQSYIHFATLKIVPDGKRLFEAKIDEFNRHHAQKVEFKDWLKEVKANDVKENDVNHYAEKLEKYNQALNQYQAAKAQAKTDGKKFSKKAHPEPQKPEKIDHATELRKYYEAAAHIKRHVLKSGKDKKASCQFVTYTDFYDKINDYFGKGAKQVAAHLKSQISQDIKAWVDKKDFLRRQRGTENLTVPMQLKGQDLKAFIDSQSKYYPELLTTEKEHPNESVLEYLFRQRIPYWVGPLNTAEYQASAGQNVHAWAAKKPEFTNETMNIYNFERVIDKEQTGQNFMNQLISDDSNYMGAPVLPNSNLDVELYKVYSELNQVTINGRKFKDYEKQALVNALFKCKIGTITVKETKDYLKDRFKYTNIALNGLANNNHFNNSLSTYHTMKRILGDKVDNPDYHDDLNLITNWLTIYQDSGSIEIQLKTIDWLTADEIKKLKKISYSGWSNMSEMVLTGIKDGNGKTLLDSMWTTTITLQSWLNVPAIKEQIEQHNADYVANHPNKLIEDMSKLPGEVRKSHNVAMQIVHNVIKIMGNVAPSYTVVESTRAASNNHMVPKSRIKDLETQINTVQGHDSFKQLFKAVIEMHQTNKTPITNREYLYFSQFGKSLYTGADLDYNQLSTYNLDHIIPQSIIKNDSLDNLALVEAKVNADKNDETARAYCERAYPASLTSWKNLNQLKFISAKKFKYLMMPELDKYTKQGFISRQFNDTSMVVKWMNLVLHSLLPNTKLIKINGVMDHELSQYYNWPKLRDYNDCHHGFDAYKNAILALYVVERYPSLSNFFEYGKAQFGVNLSKLNHLNMIAGLKPQVNNPGGVTMNPIDIKYQNLLMTEGNYWYNNPKISVVRDSYDNSGQFHQQTHISAADARKSKTEIVEAQPNHPVAKYGGYTHMENAYSAIVRISHHDDKSDTDEVTFQPIAVTMLMAKEYEHLSDHEIDANLVEKFKAKHAKQANDDVTVVRRHVRLQQLIQTDGQLVYLSTANRLQPGYQLHLPTNDIKLIAQKVPTDKQGLAQYSKALDGVLDDLIDTLQAHYQVFDSNVKRLIDHKSDFIKLDVKDKKIPGKTKASSKIIDGKLTVITKLMQACHNNGQYVKIPVFDIKSQFGNFQKANIVFHVGDKLIYRDKTGYYGNTFELR